MIGHNFSMGQDASLTERIYTGEVEREAKRRARQDASNRRRRERDQAMRDMGLTKVRGSLGGSYWE